MNAERVLRIGRREVRLTHLDKVYYPATGTTKAEVLAFVLRIAPVLLPHLEGRPLTLERFPEGAAGPSFFAKNCPRPKPSWVKTAEVRTDHHVIDFCLADDLATLLWLANLGSLVLHPSLARARDYERPTAAVFDLDPGLPATVVECCRVALRIRDLCAHLGLRAFAKTSGSKGLQLYLPLHTPTTYAETSRFAHAVAERLERETPEAVVSRMSKQLRPGKVLVDWSQNSRHKTTASVYSLRATSLPQVSTPLDWEEVARGADLTSPEALRFGPAEVLARVEKRGDLFAPVLSLKQHLPPLAAKRSIDDLDTHAL